MAQQAKKPVKRRPQQSHEDEMRQKNNLKIESRLLLIEHSLMLKSVPALMVDMMVDKRNNNGQKICEEAYSC